ncbi:MAG: FKBP-type peptidyl-prolyl cis-trans isomerase [Bacteroidales bacterium]|nr:FKBP-type peptidyl-prolyl cis-trans isomerase [Bacteroidales bacterium]
MKLFWCFCIVLILISCHSERPKPKTEAEVLAYKEPLVKVNQILVDKDSLRIARYNERKKLGLSLGLQGLWYKIEHLGKGDSAKLNKVASIKYKLYLLDNGKLCYSSDSAGVKSFIIGKSDVESGLDIGIRMMREGDKAIFILPPNLAHGLLGDGNCIPPRSIVIYEVELLQVD